VGLINFLFWLLAIYFVRFNGKEYSFGVCDGAENVLIREGYEKWDLEIYRVPT